MSSLDYIQGSDPVLKAIEEYTSSESIEERLRRDASVHDWNKANLELHEFLADRRNRLEIVDPVRRKSSKSSPSLPIVHVSFDSSLDERHSFTQNVGGTSKVRGIRAPAAHEGWRLGERFWQWD
jgi:hypothetical protein